MPAVRGLIQYIQNSKQIQTSDLALLDGSTIGIDAWKYFESFIQPSLLAGLTGFVDLAQLETIVTTQLALFASKNIRPLFVFAGTTLSDRLQHLDQAYTPDGMINTSATGKHALNQLIQGLSIQWSFDDASFRLQDQVWGRISREQYNEAGDLIPEIQVNIPPIYRRFLHLLLVKHNAAVVTAPHSVSAQLAYFARSIPTTDPAHPQPPFIHACYGYSDIMLYGPALYIHTLNFTSNTVQYISYPEMLSALHITHEQLVSASMLSGYSQAMTHPSALYDQAAYNAKVDQVRSNLSTNQQQAQLYGGGSFSFANALQSVLRFGTLQDVLDLWDVPASALAAMPSAASGAGGNASSGGNSQGKTGKKQQTSHSHQNQQLDKPGLLMIKNDDKKTFASNINAVISILNSSIVLGAGLHPTLLHTHPLKPVEMRTIDRIVKLYHQQQQQQQKKKQSQSDPSAGGEATTTAEPPAVPVPPVNAKRLQTPLPSTLLPRQLARLVASGVIQPSTISSIIGGNLLDITYFLPSQQLDTILDYFNHILRAPSLYAFCYTCYQKSRPLPSEASAAASSSQIDPRYGRLFTLFLQQQRALSKNPRAALIRPLVLNMRFNDDRNATDPRDVLSAWMEYSQKPLDTPGVDYDTARLTHSRLTDAGYWLNEELPHEHQAVDTPSSTAPLFSAAHMGYLQRRVATLPASSTGSYLTLLAALGGEEPTAGTDVETLSPTHQVIAVAMAYILTLLGFVTRDGSLSPRGATMAKAVQQLASSLGEENHSLLQTYDALFLFYLLDQRVDATELIVGQSHERKSTKTRVLGKSSAEDDRLRLLTRLCAVLPEISLLSAPSQQTDDVAQGSDASPTTTTTAPSIHLEHLDQELSAYSSLANGILTPLQYSFDCILSAVILHDIHGDNNTSVQFGALAKLLPYRMYQSTPSVALLLRYRVLHAVADPATSQQQSSSSSSSFPPHLVSLVEHYLRTAQQFILSTQHQSTQQQPAAASESSPAEPLTFSFESSLLDDALTLFHTKVAHKN